MSGRAQEPAAQAGARPPTARTVDRYSHAADAVAAQLRENGAAGVVLLDVTALAPVEAAYGVEAFSQAHAELHRLVLETCAAELGANDVVVTGELEAEWLAIFMFRPRGHDLFYRERLADTAECLRKQIQQSGNKIVYPYQREAPLIPIGHSVVFHNPGLLAERQLRNVLAAARRDADLNARIAARARAREFTDLLLAEDVTILYEPIVNVTTRDIVGYEALVRGPWESELSSPAALFKRAEETDLVFELDCLCRRAALRGAKGIEPGKLLFLNCLPTAIHDPAFRGDVLRRTLEQQRLRPADVVFEISERESIDNFSIFREARDYYAELGFRIALDDTGVAYGSLEAIMELSPDYIKADLSLVRGVDTDPPRQELLRALNAVALKLDAQIIAEGIETSEELASLQSLGIPLGQGFLFGRPAPLRRAG